MSDYNPTQNAKDSYGLAIRTIRERREGDDYLAFLDHKAVRAPEVGFDAAAMPAHLKPHQADSVRFTLKKGRAGLFLSTGLGKTACQLEWCRQSAEASNGYSLILTPLAVARQIEREAARWGYEARVIRDQSEAGPGINICNYDRLEKIEPEAFGAVSLDESSILKDFTGATSRKLREAFARHRFRLSATATPAPNDHMELGQHAEFCGVMPSNEMLMRWFTADQTNMGRYRIKGHGEQDFWDWMASWCVMGESPEDFGHDGSEYVLPPLNIVRHRVDGDAPVIKDGLFAVMSATSLHDVKRATTGARADLIAGLVSKEPSEPWLIWCDSNYESDALAKRIPEALEVRGDMAPEQKEENLDAFATGKARMLITKPSIAGHGMNFQHCARMAFVGRSFSFETWHQAVRRCWRYGQKRELQVHLAVAEGEDQIGRVVERKSEDHARMMAAMTKAMRRALGKERAIKAPYNPTFLAEVPSWLCAA